MTIHATSRRLSLLVSAFFLAGPPVALAASDNGTLQIAHSPSTGWPCSTHIGAILISGYSTSPAMGSYSPTGLTGGKVVVQLMDVVRCTVGVAMPFQTTLIVSGFSSNPGTTWLTSVTCASNTKLRSAATFSYSSGAGQATWTWSGQDFAFWIPAGGTNALCTIVHS